MDANQPQGSECVDSNPGEKQKITPNPCGRISSPTISSKGNNLV